MIACDNHACKIQWFHYPCISITRAPKGKWYCGACKTSQKKKKKDSKNIITALKTTSVVVVLPVSLV